MASPDIAVEILSPSQRVQKLRERCLWYLERGVPLALLIDPRRRAVHHFAAGAEERVLHAGDVIDLGAVIPDLQLPVDELFGALRFD